MSTDDKVGRPIIEIRPGVLRPDEMPGPDESPLQPVGHGACEHITVTLDVESRTAKCKRCGAAIDPFEHLLQLGKVWARYAGWAGHARAERSRVEGEIARLKLEKKRLADAVRRLEKKEKRLARAMHRNGISPVEEDDE